MTDIAEKAEIGVASVYRYFKTKPDIAVEAACKLWRDEISELYSYYTDEAFESKNGITRIKEILEVFLKLYDEHQDYISFIDQFDRYIIKENISKEKLKEYEKSIIDLKSILIKALDSGKADGTIRRDVSGEHKAVWDGLCSDIPELAAISDKYFDDWNKICRFAQYAIDNDVYGVHAFYNKEIFAAVYASNLLMRSTDILVTKPSELAFYPVPKLMIKRVGGHEAWGAIRAAEIGDGTIECDEVDRALQMLQLMLKEDDILTMLTENILRANRIGIYNGAYRVVELAVKGVKAK